MYDHIEFILNMYTRQEKVIEILNDFQTKRLKGSVTLAQKNNSHFLRKREKVNTISLKDLNNVISIDLVNMTVDVEGCCSFNDLCSQTLRYNLIPKVIPELKGITVGGAISGLGVESGSFRYGLVHDTVRELDVITGEGKLITCSRDLNHDLFHSLPNSLGSLGYITRVKLDLIHADKYVRIVTTQFSSTKDFFKAIKDRCALKELSFIDGVIFSYDNCYMIEGYMCDTVPSGTNLFNRYESIYYRYIRDNHNNTFYMTINDYIWRWDTDGFWGMEYHRVLGKILANNLFRKLILKPKDNSDTLIKIKRIYDKLRNFFTKIGILRTRYEDLFQDAGVQYSKCDEFMAWYKDTINIYPLWICPVNNSMNNGEFPLYILDESLIFDIGFYSRKELMPGMNADHFNRLLETKLEELNATKALYSQNSYTEESFWKQFDKNRYRQVKNKYDPNNTFPDLYTKAIH